MKRIFFFIKGKKQARPGGLGALVHNGLHVNLEQRLIVVCRVQNGEGLAVDGGITAEDESPGALALQFHEQHGILILEAAEHFTVDYYNHIAHAFAVAHDGGFQLALDFHAHGHYALHATATVAVRAVVVHIIKQGFVDALARHFHEADGGNLHDLGLGLVALEGVLHGFVHG